MCTNKSTQDISKGVMSLVLQRSVVSMAVIWIIMLTDAFTRATFLRPQGKLTTKVCFRAIVDGKRKKRAGKRVPVRELGIAMSLPFKCKNCKFVRKY